MLANRSPIHHELAADGRPVPKRSASGLVTALEPLMEAWCGTWVAHGSGNADALVVDGRSGLNVPPANPRYRLRYVWLGDEQYQAYYYGFANQGLWPLCHELGVPPVFRPNDFREYRAVNERFASVVAAEAGDDAPLVLVQDYHFALAPRALRRVLPASTVVAFWHVPWPRAHVLRSCPWASDLLRGLLASNIVGFQTPRDCVNFLESVESLVGARVDYTRQRVLNEGWSTLVRAYPVGVAWPAPVLRPMAAAAACREQICRELQIVSDVRLGIGVDRLDYTKGIDFKFLAIERLLELRPELRGRLAFVQVAEPSRSSLPEYRAIRTKILDACTRVNARFGTGSYQPIRLLEAHHEPKEVYRLYRAADFCYVGSLRDGMNLVSKEFVSARDDERGVLVLSESAGAAQQLRAALLVNPCDVEESAGVLARAIDMPIAEQSARMRLLRANVETFDARWWAERVMHDAMGARRAAGESATRQRMSA